MLLILYLGDFGKLYLRLSFNEENFCIYIIVIFNKFDVNAFTLSQSVNSDHRDEKYAERSIQKPY